MKFPLDSIEARIRSLIETLTVPEDRRDFQNRLVHEVVTAMQDHAESGEDGRIIAPSRFSLRLNPDVCQDMEGSSMLETIAEALTAAAEDDGIHFLDSPQLRLDPDRSAGRDQIRVFVLPRQPESGATSVLRLQELDHPLEPGTSSFEGAFLIMADNSVYPLKMPTINIGRRPENQIVLNDPRVSRMHAQIRYTRGQYVIFDLNSTGGTEVNGQRIRQQILKPGDVISLAGVRIIYGEETSAARDPKDDTKGMPRSGTPSEPV